ncbi:MAG: hypothetical protein LC776_00385 [Acidobacteria bacterium]|nr:hypothetical protein [Acidobacteriota bacterium]
MPAKTVNRLLDQLDELKREFGGRREQRVEGILSRLARQKFRDAKSLIRFHEILLFIRAYPQTAEILRQVERALPSFADRVKLLRDMGADLSPLDNPEVSGIAGTSVTDTFTYNIVHWLFERHPTQVKLDWDWFEDENRLAATWPRFMPLLEEDAFVEANVPYVEWLSAASIKGRGMNEVAWLIQRFESLSAPHEGCPRGDPAPLTERAELYDSLKLYVRWTPSYKATRTEMKLPVREVYYHRQPLIQRRDISLRAELESPPPALKRLSPRKGQAILDMTRETSTMRYRELYGFTHGDVKRVFQVSIGRGVALFVMGVPSGRRLPLRAYHAAMIFKNGVPVGYFEGLSLFERMESGFNFYYSFREGETAWIYARTLNIFRHLLGVTAFSLDPYQIGYENEEGIESGAFWFYRKLGFRPTRPELLKLTLAEERKMSRRPSYRTSKAVLRRLAGGPMIFELDESKVGDWDRFQVRSIGLAVQRRMAAQFGGDGERIRDASVQNVSRAGGIRIGNWSEVELSALSDFAVVLDLIPDLNRWTENERQAVVRIIRAKAGADEARYLKLMQGHRRLRAAMIKLGSGG